MTRNAVLTPLVQRGALSDDDAALEPVADEDPHWLELVGAQLGPLHDCMAEIGAVGAFAREKLGALGGPQAGGWWRWCDVHAQAAVNSLTDALALHDAPSNAPGRPSDALSGVLARSVDARAAVSPVGARGPMLQRLVGGILPALSDVLAAPVFDAHISMPADALSEGHSWRVVPTDEQLEVADMLRRRLNTGIERVAVVLDVMVSPDVPPEYAFFWKRCHNRLVDVRDELHGLVRRGISLRSENLSEHAAASEPIAPERPVVKKWAPVAIRPGYRTP